MSQRQDNIFFRQGTASIIDVVDGSCPMSAWMNQPYRAAMRWLERMMPWVLTIAITAMAAVSAARGL